MKILYVTTIGGTMSFFLEHFKMLLQGNNIIELACNTTSPVRQPIIDLGLKINHIPFSRSPISFSNVRAYKELKQLIETENYDIIHCHTPNAAAITRLVCRRKRKKGLKVFYTAHGFHFYKGAPMKNWLLYYPIEKWLSRYTDVLITINQEDYTRAKNRFSMKKVEYIPGIGIDVEKFQQSYEKVNSIKNELSVSNGKTLILSVGELNQNKNHELIIRAIADVDHVYYAIAGKGSNQSYLESLIKKLNLQNRVFLLGYREDIPQLNQAADLFAFPSIREGLGLAAIEALASGTPVVGMNTRGINEYVIEGETGFLFDNNVESCKKSIQKFLQLEFSELSRIQANCYDKAKEYSKMRSSEIMKRIYENI